MTNRYARRENFGHPIRNPLIRKHFVYRMYANDGELIYVGCTQDVRKRLAEHSSQSRWWSLADGPIKLAGPYNYEVARQVEYDAIETERPQFNYTREKRTLDKIRSRMIDREISAAIASGTDWKDALSPAIERIDRLLPSAKDERITDLMVPNARRIEREHLQSLAVAS